MEESPECAPQGRGPVLVRRRPPERPGLREALKARLRRGCTCSVQGAWALLQGLFPAMHWLRRYRAREDLAGDVMSGLLIGIILVPQAIAYSLLAGLQPVYSLYTSFFANLIYFLMGTSRHVSVGIFSLLCLMVGQVVDRELLQAGFDPAQDGPGPEANSSAPNASATTLALGLQDCGRDCYAIRVATALTLVAGIYQVRSWSTWPPSRLEHPRQAGSPTWKGRAQRNAGAGGRFTSKGRTERHGQRGVHDDTPVSTQRDEGTQGEGPLRQWRAGPRPSHAHPQHAAPGFRSPVGPWDCLPPRAPQAPQPALSGSGPQRRSLLSAPGLPGRVVLRVEQERGVAFRWPGPCEATSGHGGTAGTPVSAVPVRTRMSRAAAGGGCVGSKRQQEGGRALSAPQRCPRSVHRSSWASSGWASCPPTSHSLCWTASPWGPR